MISATETSQPFRLLDPPPELRLIIYDYAFSTTIHRPETIYYVESYVLDYWDQITQLSNLLFTSRELTNEAMPSFQKAMREYEKRWEYKLGELLKEKEE